MTAGLKEQYSFTIQLTSADLSLGYIVLKSSVCFQEGSVGAEAGQMAGAFLNRYRIILYSPWFPPSSVGFFISHTMPSLPHCPRFAYLKQPVPSVQLGFKLCQQAEKMIFENAGPALKSGRSSRAPLSPIYHCPVSLLFNSNTAVAHKAQLAVMPFQVFNQGGQA